MVIRSIFQNLRSNTFTSTKEPFRILNIANAPKVNDFSIIVTINQYIIFTYVPMNKPHRMYFRNSTANISEYFDKIINSKRFRILLFLNFLDERLHRPAKHWEYQTDTTICLKTTKQLNNAKMFDCIECSYLGTNSIKFLLICNFTNPGCINCFNCILFTFYDFINITIFAFVDKILFLEVLHCYGRGSWWAWNVDRFFRHTFEILNRVSDLPLYYCLSCII